jgi:tRNA pseudouridine55 synthase
MAEDAFLVIDKPAGLTSQQVVGRIKRLLKCRKVGHTGTLDPLATGVLPIACNRATRLIRFLDESRKVYSGEIELGVESDTLDRDGTVVARHPGRLTFDQDAIAEVFAGFLGEITQVPPLYSAIKSRGKPLYAYARAGIEVEIPERRVEIYSFELLSCELPKVAFRVVCSKGTYVRSLAAEAGRKLGCGGRIWSLRREASGPFTLDRAVSLETLEELVAAGREIPWQAPLTVLDHLPRLLLSDPELAVMAAHGRSLPLDRLTPAGSETETGIESDAGEPVALVDPAGQLLAIAARDLDRGELRLLRVMVSG